MYEPGNIEEKKMKMKKIAVVVALWFAASASHGAFIDNRKTDAVVEVNYKSIVLEDLVDDIVPDEFVVNYGRADLRKKVLRISGKGTWQQLLTQATASAAVIVTVDLPGRKLHISDRAPAVPVASPPARLSAVASTAITHVGQTQSVPPATIEKKDPVWVVKPGSSLRTILNEYAARAGWVVEYNYKDPQTLEDKDLRLGGGMRVEGDFKKFVKELFASLPESAKIRAELWSENDPPTVYVFRKGIER